VNLEQHGISRVELGDLSVREAQHSSSCDQVGHLPLGKSFSPAAIFSDIPHPDGGQPPVIIDHCQEALDQGRTEYIWLCMRRGGGTNAKDIQLSNGDTPLGIYDLRKECGWWKRHSMFSVIGVKEVLVCRFPIVVTGFLAADHKSQDTLRRLQ
jgi:hypothetical protein